MKILFVAWDSPSVTYMEGLFLPMFNRLKERYGYELHIIHFTWGITLTSSKLVDLCDELGMLYTIRPVAMRPSPAVGKYFATLMGSRFIFEYIRRNSINVAIVRSTMPAKMVQGFKDKIPGLKIVFDADGLPIDERVDFAGLVKDSLRYRTLMKIERNAVRQSDVVLTRTLFASELLSNRHKVQLSKFYKVLNGRDPAKFHFNEKDRSAVRKELGIPMDTKVLVYCGSVGPQYGIDQMVYLHAQFKRHCNDAVLLLITNNQQYLDNKLSEVDRSGIICMQLPFEDIATVLSAGDIALALRKDFGSMLGVSPIKLGEYLLMGLPVIASARIGDSSVIMRERSFCFLLDSFEQECLDEAVRWLVGMFPISPAIRAEARSLGLQKYSLDEAADSYQAALRSVI